MRGNEGLSLTFMPTLNTSSLEQDISGEFKLQDNFFSLLTSFFQHLLCNSEHLIIGLEAFQKLGSAMFFSIFHSLLMQSNRVAINWLWQVTLWCKQALNGSRRSNAMVVLSMEALYKLEFKESI